MANRVRFGVGRRGGKRLGAGRPGRKPGVPDKKTQAFQKVILDLTEKTGKSAKEEMAWDFQFLGTLARESARNGDMETAAKYAVMASEAGARAAPYMHQRLPAQVNINHSYDLSKLNDEQVAALEGLLRLASPDQGADSGGEDQTQH
jgi:hypothetical protein